MAQDTLTVMTYNIYHGENPDVSGEGTVAGIAELINRHQPDFVALQEIDSMTTRLAKLNNGRSFDLADSLAKLTNMHGYFGRAINFEGGGYGIGILSKKKFDARRNRLPNPRKGEPRVLLQLEGKTPKGYPIIFAGTHLDHQHEANRLAQVEAISQKLTGNDSPVILAGDFNFPPGSRGYQQMARQWIDAGLQSPQDDEPALTYPTENPQKRIDYIWLSKGWDWKVLEYQTPEVGLSDHWPVVAKIIVYPAD
ncbi:MAG: endonuclease/exonuclease/phosphatase family protein [Fodinibius sp.]|nr:endonuclease/exonuclease/phosphatase family protein [Fodinibius sp.]